MEVRKGRETTAQAKTMKERELPSLPGGTQLWL